MHYKVKEKITQKLDCSLLVVCTSHVLVCREMVLHSMNFSGKENLSWEFSSPIRYIKVVGGAPEQEVFALGLKNGEVIELGQFFVETGVHHFLVCRLEFKCIFYNLGMEGSAG